MPIDRSLSKTYTVKSGTSDLSHYNIISGRQLPEQIIIGIVEETALRGDIEKNPFNFKDFGLREASIVANGVHEPSESYKLNITSGDKADLYARFLENTGVYTDDREFGFSMADYYGGNLLYIIYLDPIPKTITKQATISGSTQKYVLVHTGPLERHTHTS